MSERRPRPIRGASHALRYFEGLGIGLIPLALFFLSLRSSGPLGSVAGFLYIAQIVAAIICLVFSRTRFIGYGLLTLVILAPPIAFQIGCMVSLQGHI